MKKAAVAMAGLCVLLLAGAAWGQSGVKEHYSLLNLQGFGGAEQADGHIVRLQVDYFQRRDGSFGINIMANSEHWQNYELISGMYAYPQNVPEEYVKANENHIIVDIPDVTQITGDFGCNNTYSDPSACPRPMPIKASFIKSVGSTQTTSCINHEFAESRKYLSGGSSGYTTARLEGTILEGEIDPVQQVGGSAYIYFWNSRVKELAKNH